MHQWWAMSGKSGYKYVVVKAVAITGNPEGCWISLLTRKPCAITFVPMNKALNSFAL